MHEALYVLSGLLAGTVLTGGSVLLGAYLSRKTYTELTNPPYEEDTNTQGEDKQTNDIADGYDWDEYQSVLKPPLGDEVEEPKA